MEIIRNSQVFSLFFFNSNTVYDKRQNCKKNENSKTFDFERVVLNKKQKIKNAKIQLQYFLKRKPFIIQIFSYSNRRMSHYSLVTLGIITTKCISYISIQ